MTPQWRQTGPSVQNRPRFSVLDDTKQPLTSVAASSSDNVSPDTPGIRPFPQAVHIPLQLIDPNPDQPRRSLEDIEELAQHVKQHGLLQPVVVAPAANSRYALIAGHRRFAALRWLAAHDTYPDRWYDIPAVIRTVEAEERLVLALSENFSRHNLSDADLATAIQLLVDLRGWSQTDVARRLGVTSQWIGQYVLVLADAELAALVQSGQLSISVANQVRQAQTPEDRQAALDAALHDAPFRIVRSLAKGETPDVGPSIPSAPAVESDFQPAGNGPGPEDGSPPITIRSLAVATLLQQARRARRPTVGASALQAALEHDLRSLAPTSDTAEMSP